MSSTWLEQWLSGLNGQHGFNAAEWGRRSHEGWLRERLPGLGAFHFFPPHLHDPALPVALADSSARLALTFDYLETLRMDQLYMVASEARRVLRPGGLWLLRSVSTGSGAWQRFLGGLHIRRTGERPLELTHYISPEDWETLGEIRERAGLISRQALTLRRL
jgi:hypothetical protein